MENKHKRTYTNRRRTMYMKKKQRMNTAMTLQNSKDYAEALDGDSAIAAATREIDHAKAANAAPPAEAYLYRGIARCFKEAKDDNYKDAIADLSTAISLTTDKNILAQARFYRAYAYYLNADYASALTDCSACTEKPAKQELLGKIYLALNNYEKAVRHFDKALRAYVKQDTPPPPSLPDTRREARKRMNSV